MRSRSAARGLNLQFYLGFPAFAELQFFAGLLGNVHDNFAAVTRHVIVHQHYDGFAVFDVGYFDVSTNRYRGVRRCKRVRIIPLPATGPMSIKAATIACCHARLGPAIRLSFLRSPQRRERGKAEKSSDRNNGDRSSPHNSISSEVGIPFYLQSRAMLP